MSIVLNPYEGSVEYANGSIVVITKNHREQYPVKDVLKVNISKRKANSDELTKGALKGFYGGGAAALVAAILTLGAGAIPAAITGAMLAGSIEFFPKCEFTIHFKDGSSRMWTFLDDAGFRTAYEKASSQINSRCESTNSES